MSKENNVKEDDERSISIIYKKSIWKFYQWVVVLAPVFLMLSHWYIFYVFSQNSSELMRYSKENEICIAWIYSIVYLYVPLVILPASYFFKWNNIFRIPFVYFIFINVERWYYGSWFCTNEMVGTHYFLIYCIISMYLIELLGLVLRYKEDLPKYLRIVLAHSFQKIRKPLDKNKEDKYDRIMKALGD